MATLKGIVRFSGQLGDFIFYRNKKKDVVRRKSDTYQLSENSKKSAQDFGEVSKHAAYIRKAFAPVVKAYGCGDLTSRLTKRITAIFKSIPAAHAGNKKIQDGNLKLLEGFEFNAHTRLDQLLLQKPRVILADGGILQLLLPKSDTINLVMSVPQSDEFMLQVMVFNFDVSTGQYETIMVNDLRAALTQTHFPGAKLHVPIEQQGDRILLIAIGISYLYEQFRKEDRRYFACQISHCYHIKDGVEVEFVEPVREEVAQLDEEEKGLSWEMGEE